MKRSVLLLVLFFVIGIAAIKTTQFSIDHPVQTSHTDVVISFDSEMPSGSEILIGTKDQNCLLFDDDLEPEDFTNFDDAFCYDAGVSPFIVARLVAVEKEVNPKKGCVTKFPEDETVGVSFKIEFIEDIPANAVLRCQVKIAAAANFQGPLYVGLPTEKPTKTEFNVDIIPSSLEAKLSNNKSHFTLKIRTNARGSHPFELSCAKYDIPCQFHVDDIYCDSRMGRFFSRTTDDNQQLNFVYTVALDREITCHFHLNSYFPITKDGEEAPKLSVTFPEIKDASKRTTGEVSYSLHALGPRVYPYYSEYHGEDDLYHADIYFEIPNHMRAMKVGSEYEFAVDDDFIDILDIPEKDDDEDGDEDNTTLGLPSLQHLGDDPIDVLPSHEFRFERMTNPVGVKVIFTGNPDELYDDAIVRARLPMHLDKLALFSEDTVAFRLVKRNGQVVPKNEYDKNTFHLNLRGYLRLRSSTIELDRESNVLSFSTTAHVATMNIESVWYIGYRFDLYIPTIVDGDFDCTVTLRGKTIPHQISQRQGDFYVMSEYNLKHGETIDIKCSVQFPEELTKFTLNIITIAGVLGHPHIDIAGVHPRLLVPHIVNTIQEKTNYKPKKLSQLVISYPAYIDDDSSTAMKKLEAILNDMMTLHDEDGKKVYETLDWEKVYIPSLLVDDVYEDKSIISPFESHTSWLTRITAMAFHAEIYLEQQLTDKQRDTIHDHNISNDHYLTPQIQQTTYYFVEAAAPVESDTTCLGRSSSLGKSSCMKLYPGQGCTYNSQCYDGECVNRLCVTNSFTLPSSSAFSLVIHLALALMVLAVYMVIA